MVKPGIFDRIIMLLKSMKRIILIICGLLLGCSKGNSSESSENKILNMKNEPINISDVTVKNMDGQDVKLSDYKGKVLMIVNVASYCGYTKQYSGLQEIYEKYSPQGFEILAFPCNDFGNQEPGSNDEIRTFCETKYKTTFPMFDKVSIIGDGKSELYSKLINYEPSGDVSWNFEKFVIDKDGNVVGRFKSKITPQDEMITGLIEKELEK